MKRLVTTMMAIALPVTAWAQQPEGRASAEGVVIAQAASVAATKPISASVSVTS